MNMSSRLFFQTSTCDPSTALPLYVFDTSFLPTQLLNNYNNLSLASLLNKNDETISQLINELIAKLPNENYCLILFASGITNTNNAINKELSSKLPLNLTKLFKMIPNQKKNYINKIYLVHGNWLIKSFVEIFKNFWNFKKEIINCENLTVLNQYIDVTTLKISLKNYLIDKITYSNNKIITNKFVTDIYNKPLINSNYLSLMQFSKIYNNLISYLIDENLNTTLPKHEWKLLIKFNNPDDETSQILEILSDCLKRDQLLYLSDFSFLEHYLVLIKFILELNKGGQPILPINLLIINNDLNFKNIADLNFIFNEALRYEQVYEGHRYNNGYLLIKIFKLFNHLSIKLNNEFKVFSDGTENNDGNLNKLRSRQQLRLVLSFTKILFNKSTEFNRDLNDFGFDNLFKFITAVIKSFNKIKVFNKYSLNDFNNLINCSIDLKEFEALEMSTVEGAKEQQQLEQQPESMDSPIFENKVQLLHLKLRNSQPPTPPVPRKNHNLKKESRTTSTSALSIGTTASNSSSENSLYSLANNDQVDYESHNDQENANPIQVNNKSTSSLTSRLKNELVKPSDNLTSKLIKYTEKDLIIQQQRLNQLNINSTANIGTVKGRNVSKLTMMYEEQFLLNGL